MGVEEILGQIRALPSEERRELVNLVQQEFCDGKPTPEQLEEFERRGEEMSKHPERGIPWEQVKAELHDRLKSRKARSAK
jgi:putative addiction module component (TIGR02574 family)